MSDWSKPLRMKREGMALYMANGYGPSAAYSSAGYSFKSRQHLSKNASNLAACLDVHARVHWLRERPNEAARLLRDWVATRDKEAAQDRSQALMEAVEKRQAAIARRRAPKSVEAAYVSTDETTLLELLHHCQDEAKSIYERAKLERADAYIIKTSLAAHRDFTVMLQRFRDYAKAEDSKPTPEKSTTALQVYARMCAALHLQPPVLNGAHRPHLATTAEREATHDESELRFNITATLHEYDLLSESGNRPDMRVQLKLLDVLAKSTQRLIELRAQRRNLNGERRGDLSANFEIDPGIVLRWAKQQMIA